jgi:hypothetical protein
MGNVMIKKCLIYFASVISLTVTSCSSESEEEAEKQPVTANEPEVLMDSLEIETETLKKEFYWPKLLLTDTTPVTRRIEKLLEFSEITGFTIEQVDSQYNACECGLVGTDFSINYNSHGILDIAFQLVNYYSEEEYDVQFLTIDLHKGKVLKIEDLLLDTTFKSLAELCTIKVNEAVRVALKEYKKSDEYDEAMESFFGKYSFKPGNLESFSISKNQIVFTYDYAFPVYMEFYTPDKTISVSFEELKPFVRPDGMLGFLISKNEGAIN